VGKARARIASQIYAVLASDANLARRRVNPPALTSASYRFGFVNFPAEAEIDGQLVVDPPCVLTKKKKRG